MSLRFWYSDPDSGTVELTAHIEPLKIDLHQSAESGSVLISTIEIDDPDGTLSIVGLRRFWVTATAITGSENVIYNGFTGDDISIVRGSYRTGAARMWKVNLNESNVRLGDRIMVGGDNKRPAETDVARITWLYTTNEAGNIDDFRYFPSTPTFDMDKVDYLGQRLLDVQDSAARISGKNYFLVWFEDVQQLGLWYDFATSTAFTSSIYLSNDLADIDNVTVFPLSEDAEWKRSWQQVNSGVLTQYDGGYKYQELTSTILAGRRRDVNQPDGNIKTAAKATAANTRYLYDAATPEDLPKTMVILPESKLDQVRQGMRIPIRATHWPGYQDDYVYCRILNTEITCLAPELFAVALELSGDSAATAPPPPPTDEPPLDTTVIDTACCTIATRGDGTCHSSLGDVTGELGTGPALSAAFILYPNCTYHFIWSATAVGSMPSGPGCSRHLVYNMHGEVRMNPSPYTPGDPIPSPGDAEYPRIDLGATKYNFGNTTYPYFGGTPFSGLYAFDFTTSDDGDPHIYACDYAMVPFTNLGAVGSMLCTTVSYVSGPDPRFDGS